MNTTASPDLNNPFPGLRCFQSQEDYLFFGRHEQIEDLLRRLRQNRLVAVVGTSGSGKSSLVRAGLLPSVLGGGMSQAGSDWEIAVMRPGGSPLAQLAGALCDAGLYDADAEDAQFHLRATLTRSRNGLVEALRQSRAALDSRLLLVVDQFEELFRFNRASAASQEESVQFVNLLLHATQQSDQRVYVVLTMRSDFLGECSQFLGLAEAVNEGEFLIPRMSRDQIQEAIEGPIHVCGASIAPRLLFRLLNDVEDNQDQLPVLQHALMRTWDLWKGSCSEAHESEGRVIRVPETAESSGDSQSSSLRQQAARPLDLEHYEATGGMHQALSRHADEVFEKLPSDAHRSAAARIFQALTERGSDGRGIRRPTRLNALVSVAGVEASVAVAVIEAYRAPGVTFLMPPATVPLADGTVIDISHESLMRVWGRLRNWVQEEAQSVGIFHRLAESAALHEVGKAGLYRDPELGIALAWRDEAHPNAAWADQYGGGFDRAMAYLDLSRVEAEREEHEREAARQRELAQAKEIAENQRLRAEEKSRSARRMRWLMRVAMAVAVVAIIASIYAGKAKREALRNEKRANASAQVADEQKKMAEAAEAKVRQKLYVADMNRAGQAYAEGSFRGLDELLSRHKPTEGPAAGPDLRGPEWYFWQHASRRELASVGCTFGVFMDVAVAPDQRTVATVNWPGDVSLYDVASRNLVKLIRITESASVGPNKIVSIAYSPDGATLAATGPRPYLRRWDTRTWLPLTPDLTFPDGYSRGASAGQAPSMSAIAYSPNGKHLLAVGTDNGLVALWDTRTWQVVKVLDVSEEARGAARVHELAFSHDGRRLAAGGGRTLVIWDTTHFEKIFDRPSDSSVETLAFSPPDDRLLVSGSGSGEVNLWDMTSLSTSPLKQLHKARARIRQVRLSPQGRYLAASTDEGNAILVWELQPSPRLISTLKGHSKGSLIDFVGDEFTLWSAGQDWRLKVWDIRASGVSTEIPNTRDSVGLSYLAGGRLAWRTPPPSQDPAALVTASIPWGFQLAGLPTPIRLYDVAHARELPPWKEGEKFTLHATSANGRFLAAQGEDRRLRLWNVEDGVLLGTTPGPASEGDLVTGLLTVANNGSRVAWAEMRGYGGGGFTVNSLHLWTPSASRHVRWPSTEIVRAFGLKLSEDGTLLAASGEAGGFFPVVVWDAVPDQPVLLQKIRRPNPAFSLAFSPDGSRLACGTYESDIRLINPRTGKDLGAPLLGHAEAVGSVAFFPDGNTLVSGSMDQTIRLWDVKTGVWRATLPALEDTNAKELILEPQGRWMVSVLVGQEARLWQFNDALDPRRKEMFWSEEGQPAGNHGDFAKARRVARQAVETAPDAAPDQTDPWFALAALAVHEGDLEDFRKVRRDMLAHFRDKPYLMQAALTAAVCTMLPATPEELAAGLKLAVRPAAEDSVGWLGCMAAASLTLGDYRLGHYEAAVKKAEEYLGDNARHHYPDLDIPAVLAQAMSQHQLQKPAEARDALAKAREMMAVLDEEYPGTPERPNNWRWNRWMLIKALLAEAETLIDGKPSAPQPPRAGGARP